MAYLADTAAFPYGLKDSPQLRDVVFEVARRAILRLDPAMIVVACNTASVVALETLRARFEIPFVGVVPAIKPAASLSEARKIGVLATSRTVGEVYVENLIRDFASDCLVHTVAGTELVDFVEYGGTDQVELRRITRRAVAEFRAAGVDTVVLGCTHFVHVEKAIKEILGGSVRIVDSRGGVTRQIIRICTRTTGRSHAELGESVGKPSYGLYVTGTEDHERWRVLAMQHGLDFGGQL
jgi:glutamate racemase